MASRVGDYICATWGAEWQWGVVDCTMWPADWCLQEWGVDPAANYRGTYSDAAAARELIGGDRLIEVIDGEIGDLRRDEARDGDVGVIRVAGQMVGAIRFGGKWAFRSTAGIGIVRADALAIWGK